MSSVTPDSWLADNSPVDDIGIVELFLKSLDSSASGSGVADHCWTPIVGSDSAVVNSDFVPSVPSEKIGYEPFSLTTLANCFKENLEIKQEPFEESCLLTDISPGILDVGIQCSSSITSLQYDFSNLRYSQLQGFSQTGPSLTSSENWAANNYLASFDSFKFVPELIADHTTLNQAPLAPPGYSTQLRREQHPHPYKSNRFSHKIEEPGVQQSNPAEDSPPVACDVVVKQEPADESMSLSGHFMCHTMFMVNSPPGPKCSCDLSKGPHFLCPASMKPAGADQYDELLKRGNSSMLPSPPHQSIRSDKERPFTCDECGKSFLLKHHLVTHSRVHTGVRPFGCSDCGKTFAHKHCLVTHQRLHSGQRPFQCLECKKSFTLKHHLVTHARTHSKDRPYHCEECGRTFSQKRNLVTHAKLHSGERPFQCAICGECFSQREHLLAHSRFHGGESAFVCLDCGEAFARKFQLVDHRRQHGHSPYSCTICGKEFLQKRTLTAHTKLHEGGRPFCCKLCSQTFPRMSELIAHSRIHTCFTCKECGCSFPTHEGLVHHLQHHTQMLTRPILPPSKPFQCPECGAGFAQKHGLTQHRNKKHAVSPASLPQPPPPPPPQQQMLELNRAAVNERLNASLAHNCDIMEQIKHQVLTEQLKAKIQ